jgi:hypothetical protein
MSLLNLQRGFSQMKRVVIVVTGVLVVALLVGIAAAYRAQRADYGWNPSVATPAFGFTHPRVVIDQAHHNASSAGLGGRYVPFGRLLEVDGYDVRRGRREFSLSGLDSVQVLVIANASGASKPQLFGINIPVPAGGRRGDPAFTASEVQAVRAWVEHGGSLLLIADHAPFGAASESLAAAFGIRMNGGFVEVAGEPSDPLVFSRENGRLGNHPIIAGDGPATAIRRVMTFTGQSLDGPAGAVVLLRLPESAVEYVPADDSLTPEPAGGAQGLALEWGEGRVVVLGEAAMLTAQVYCGVPFGMTSPGNDNRQLALNIMHWLSRRL